MAIALRKSTDRRITTDQLKQYDSFFVQRQLQLEIFYNHLGVVPDECESRRQVEGHVPPLRWDVHDFAWRDAANHCR